MDKKKEREKANSWLPKLVERLSFWKIISLWIVIMLSFGTAYFYMSIYGVSAFTVDGNAISDDAEGFANALIYSAVSLSNAGSSYSAEGIITKSLAALESFLGLLLYSLVIMRLVGYKQDTILEELHEINYEEAFTNYRRGLALVRADIIVIIEKLENNILKPREVKDLWIVFSGLDQTLTNIRDFVIATAQVKGKRLEPAKLELIFSSIKLTMNKVAELIRSLKSHNIDWKDELLLTSAYYDMQLIREIMDYELKKTSDRKLIDKINSLKIVIDDLEAEMRGAKKAKEESAASQSSAQTEEMTILPPNAPIIATSATMTITTEPAEKPAEEQPAHPASHAPHPTHEDQSESHYKKDFELMKSMDETWKTSHPEADEQPKHEHHGHHKHQEHKEDHPADPRLEHHEEKQE